MSMPIGGGSNGVIAAEVIAKAKELHATANTQFKNEQTVEKNDMSKANSVFTAAENIIKKSTKNGSKVERDTTTKLAEKEKLASDLGEKKINPTKQLIQEYTTKLEELNQKRKEIEQKLKEAGAEVKESEGDDIPQLPAEEPASKPTKGSKTGKGGKANATQKTSGKKQGDSGKKSKIDVGGNVQALKTQLEAINGEIKTTSDNLTSEQKNMESYEKTLETYDKDIDEIASDGEDSLDFVQDDMQNDMDAKRNELNPILESQSKSLGKNTEMSDKTKSFANNEIKQALSDQNTSDSEKRTLQKLGKDLKVSSKKLGKESGLAGKNEKNVNEAIPEYKKNMTDAEMAAIKNDFRSMNNSINQAYKNALKTIGDIQLSAAEVSAGGTSQRDSKDSKISSDITSKAGSLAQGALNGEDMGDMMKDMLISTGMDMAKGALDKILPGLGAGLDMLGSIFGGFF